ncbi:MAG: hypothetical protein DHS20C17_05650 [Cyclobacteriaceae bacterium]|nr:MAG: hypothetical protein DHS20C17_05650 [Cyclobacteriaceae bacterium]
MNLTSLLTVIGGYLVIHLFITLVRACLRTIKLSSIFTTENLTIEDFARGIIRRAFKPGTFILAIMIFLALIIATVSFNLTN